MASVTCKHCGAGNPDSSLYCQDCGSRLGDWEPAESSQRMATPPTGLSRAQQPPAPIPCPRCGSTNKPHVRFCNNCGFQLGGPSSAPAPAPEAAAESPVCWRCFGVGDAGAEFCKHCGARYADAPSGAPPSPTPGEPRSHDPGPPEAAPGEGALPSGPAPPAAPPRPSPATSPAVGPYPSTGRSARARLVSILKDGSDGREYAITDDHTDIGRTEGHIVLADDPYMSPRHARLQFRGDTAFLRDLDTVNGVYLRLREAAELADGDMLLLGQQVLRFDVLEEMELPLGPATQHGVMVFGTPEVPRLARLVQYTTEGVGRDVHYLYRDETVIGREQGDLVFTDDPFMSRRHAAVTIDRSARRFAVRDLDSSNGTAIRFRGERSLRHQDQFRVGRHLFRFELGSGGG
jgi:pSer/pThr/pTyr-binding forkhead associated (FHA) protein